MAAQMAGSQILRDFGNNWLECQDALGIFYFNQATQQSADGVPPELAAAGVVAPVVAGVAPAMVQVAAAPQVQMGVQPDGTAVLRELPGSWLECQDAQGIFYFNSVTQQSSDAPPPEVMVADPNIAVVAAPAAPGMVQPVAAGGDSTILRELPNNWLECLDAQGVFYFHKLTQQSLDTIPAELVGMVPMAAPQQIVSQQVVSPMVAQVGAPAVAALGGRPAIKAKVLGGGIAGLEGVNAGSYAAMAATSYAPMAPVAQQVVTQQMVAPASFTPMMTAPASYAPLPAAPASYTPGFMQTQYAAPAPASFTPLPVVQEPQMIQVVQETVAAPQQVIYQQAPPSITAMPTQVQAGPMPKSAFGDWAVFDGVAGEYFVKVSTGEQFAQPTPELVAAYKAHKEAGLIITA